jgi:rhodanese-related sulfurtransferase
VRHRVDDRAPARDAAQVGEMLDRIREVIEDAGAQDDVDARAGDLLPDVTATIVTYCSNPSCGNSKAVARRLEKLGYTDVRTYPGGIQDWVEAGLPVESGAVAEACA